jgi:hypothetical protein
MVGNDEDDDDDDVDVMGGLRFVALFLGTKNLEGLAATLGVIVVVACRTAAAVSTADCNVLLVDGLLEE